MNIEFKMQLYLVNVNKGAVEDMDELIKEALVELTYLRETKDILAQSMAEVMAITKGSTENSLEDVVLNCVEELSGLKRLVAPVKPQEHDYGNNDLEEYTSNSKCPEDIPYDCIDCKHEGQQSYFPGPCTGCGGEEGETFNFEPTEKP